MSSYPPDVAARMRADLSEKKRQAWANRDANGYSTRDTAVTRPEVCEQIAASVKARWQEGAYAGRVNGMTGVTAASSPTWTWGRTEYRAVLAAHEPTACTLCGTTDGTIDAHHVDEDRDNYLLTNLMWLCVPCHMWRFHYDDRGTSHVKRPFVTLTKRFGFEYAHVLPWHPGKCGRIHGHSGHLTVAIRGRLDPNDVVVDFYDIGAAVKLAVVDPLDHQMLNDFFPNPTSEALLIEVWRRLEAVGLKGIASVTFSETESSTTTITAADLIEAFGWDKTDAGDWLFVPKRARP